MLQSNMPTVASHTNLCMWNACLASRCLPTSHTSSCCITRLDSLFGLIRQTVASFSYVVKHVCPLFWLISNRFNASNAHASTCTPAGDAGDRPRLMWNSLVEMEVINIHGSIWYMREAFACSCPCCHLSLAELTREPCVAAVDVSMNGLPVSRRRVPVAR